MFRDKRLVFYYAVTPVHMGAGQALGVIDNPIQRERHTEHPCFAGSGIKGAFRQAARELWKNGNWLDRIFGPEREGADHAGAISFTDAQLLLFPVRSLKGVYVYATSALALQRLLRFVSIAGTKHEDPAELPELVDEEALVISDDILVNAQREKQLVLESFMFKVKENVKGKESLKKLAEWLSQTVLPQDNAFSYFREKIQRHTVMLSDNQLTYFAQNATFVEPHVRINDITGTADEHGLFFTENLPPESLLVGLVMASEERLKKGSERPQESLTQSEVVKKLTESFDKKAIQVGGDATTGRGQIIVSFA